MQSGYKNDLGAMVTISLQSCSVVLLCVLTVSEAGLIKDSVPLDGARGWYIFQPFRLPNFNTFWTDIPKRATNFLEKLIPQPIKDFFNFDPAPEWVPHPKDFQLEDDTQVAESRNLDTDDDDWEYEEEEEDIKNHQEKGNLHWLGRDVIRSLTQLTDTFSNISGGLDTDRNFFSGLLGGFKDKIKAIVPGTQWCGDGNVARTKKDLGFFYKTDSCCREHDNCHDFIEKDQMKYGLSNNGLFTRSNCYCDKKFYNCLKDSNDMISNQIGLAYFSVLGPQCFEKQYPIIDCRIRVGLTNRCIEYEFDNSSEKIYQWFDNPEF
ncbi:secretory Phospholipase A2 [Carabus blaptoides fortunei]